MALLDTRDSGLVYAAGDVLVYSNTEGATSPVGFEDLVAPWLCMGWIDTSGITFKLSESLKDVNAAGTLEAIRTLVTAAPKTFDATFVEGLNPVVRAAYDDVDISDLAPTSGVATYTLPEIPSDNRRAYIFDTFDGDKRLRSYIPSGKVTTRGNDQQQQADATMLALTFTAYPAPIGAVRSAVKRYINYGSEDVSIFFE